MFFVNFFQTIFRTKWVKLRQKGKRTGLNTSKNFNTNKFKQTAMKKFSILLMALAAFATTTFIGCKKEKEIEEDFASEQEMSEQMTMSEADYTDVGNITDEASSGELTSYKGGCATVTHDSTSSPRKIIIDFGTANCLCRDGKNRRGKIIVTYNGRYRNMGTVITTTFDNYFVNDNQIMGTRVVTNMGPNTLGQPTFTVVVNGSIILSGGRGTITHNANRTRTWVAGYTTPMVADDAYTIEGSTKTVGTKGDSFEATIRTALRVEVSCSNIVSGIVDFTRTGRTNRTSSINYGNGACDRLAVLTLPNGRTINILLR